MPERLAKRLLLIGWDAADWRVIRPLMEAGQMPTLRGLVDGGVHGNLATLQPAMSPMLWTSVATGKRADRHGIHGFLEPLPDAGGVRPVTSTSRRGKALWNIAHQNGLRTLSVGWYATHPAEPVRGAAVSDRFFAPGEHPPAGSVHPPEARDALAEMRVDPKEIVAGDLAAFVPRLADLLPEDYKPLNGLAQILAKNASVQAVATRLMLDHEWDLATIFFDGLDHLGHWFMPFHPPRRGGIDERQFGLFEGVMTGGYRFFDMMLEALLAHAGPQTTVLLVSDHGFKSDELRPAGKGWDAPVDWHRRFGIAVAAGPGVRAGEKLYAASVLDVTPTALHLLGLPLGRDMDGRAWAEVTTSDRPPEFLGSWDEVAGDAGLHDEELREDPADAVAALRQLVELGYVAAPSDDAAEAVRRTLRDNRINLALSVLDSRPAAAVRAVVEPLLDDYPQDPLVLLIAAQAALARRDAAAAVGLVDRAETAGGTDATVRSLRAETAMLAKRHAEAAELYRGILADGLAGGNALAAQCRLGDALVRLGDPAAARRAYLDGLKIDPDHAPAWYGVARLALEDGQADEAVAAATRAVSLVHAYPKAHFLLGRALVAAGRRADAVTALEVCAAMAPGLLPCVRQLADLKRELGHRDAARFETKALALRARRQAEAASRRGDGLLAFPGDAPAAGKEASRADLA